MVFYSIEIVRALEGDPCVGQAQAGAATAAAVVGCGGHEWIHALAPQRAVGTPPSMANGFTGDSVNRPWHGEQADGSSQVMNNTWG